VELFLTIFAIVAAYRLARVLVSRATQPELVPSWDTDARARQVREAKYRLASR